MDDSVISGDNVSADHLKNQYGLVVGDRGVVGRWPSMTQDICKGGFAPEDQRAIRILHYL